MMFLRTLPIGVVVYIVLAMSAGRWDAPWLAAYAASVWLTSGLIYTLAPAELVRERLKPPSDRDRKSRLISIPLMLVHYAIAGLDVRLGWSAVPMALQIAGLALVLSSLALVGWVLVTNPFASTAVRIQGERGHSVIRTGPYAIVRHPMYLAVLGFGLGSGVALGSWWASLPLVPVLAVFVKRTLLEDRMLHEELPGYRDYAASVRWRVVPGVF